MHTDVAKPAGHATHLPKRSDPGIVRTVVQDRPVAASLVGFVGDIGNMVESIDLSIRRPLATDLSSARVWPYAHNPRYVKLRHVPGSPTGKVSEQ